MTPALQAFILALILLILLLASSALAEDPATPGEARIESKEHRAKDGPYATSPLPYRLLMPDDFSPSTPTSRRWPLILFLHGAGERGSDNQSQWKYLPTWMSTPEARATHKVFLLAPQCPADKSWSPISWDPIAAVNSPSASPETGAVLELLGQVIQQYPVDGDRVVLTGLSMGGYGSWELATRRPEQWSAVAPICGGGLTARAPLLKDLPLWAFHGAKDPTVPVAQTRDMIQAIRAAGGAPRYTEYPEAGHDSWTAAYRDPALVEWMLGARRRPPAHDGLPRVLVIGDSISIGTTPRVKTLLEGKAVVERIAVNGGDSANVLASVAEWCRTTPADVVVLNCGLHDLKLPRESGKHQQPLEAYERNLRAILEWARKASRARWIWATTTPVDDTRHDTRGVDFRRLQADVLRYNEVALGIVREAGLEVVDLHEATREHASALLGPDGVHFTQEGYDVLAKALAKGIATEVEKSKR